MLDVIEISDQPFDPSAVLGGFGKGLDHSGAIVSFTGKVRADKGAVQALYLEHYPGVTERSIQEFVSEARRRFTIDTLHIIHRVGTLKPGEPIVFVAVSAAHRRHAFLAADFLMDFLKTKAFFWKKEIRATGTCWIEPRPDDYDDVKRWDAES